MSDQTTETVNREVLLNYKEAADFLNIPLATLYAWVSQKRVPHIRLGARVVRFSKRELETWLGNGRVEASVACTAGERGSR